VPVTQPQWQLPLSEDDHAFAKAQLGDKPTIVISPAASKDERNWLPERYAQFADYAVGKGYQVVLCGSPAAREKRWPRALLPLPTYHWLTWWDKPASSN
jgi:ADP-heptose:LPS heptosyltransferase